jgi:hypothetical protein
MLACLKRSTRGAAEQCLSLKLEQLLGIAHARACARRQHDDADARFTHDE